MKRTINYLLLTALVASALLTGTGCSGTEAKAANLDAAKRQTPPTGRVGKNQVNWKDGE